MLGTTYQPEASAYTATRAGNRIVTNDKAQPPKHPHYMSDRVLVTALRSGRPAIAHENRLGLGAKLGVVSYTRSNVLLVVVDELLGERQASLVVGSLIGPGVARIQDIGVDAAEGLGDLCAGHIVR